MSGRIKVGLVGATGMVGQNFIQLLEHHPWFEISYLAASQRSANQKYSNAIAGRWLMNTSIPDVVSQMVVHDALDVDAIRNSCSVVFSAIDMDKDATAELELRFAAAGLAVVSNNSAHRFTPDVPILIPEVNPHHLDIIDVQRKNRGWTSGLLVVKSNCSIQSFMTPLYALISAGYPVSRLMVTTLQALSGAGYPGPSALDMIDNVIPYIKGEEEKSETEPLKILSSLSNGKFTNDCTIRISAHCNRVPVIHGHMACVSLEFQGVKAPNEEIIDIWKNYRSLPQECGLPSAPQQPIIYFDQADRPQPRKDRDLDKAMAVSVGRLRLCSLLDIKFVGLHHNTIRGAAGGAILTAELLKARGLI